MITTIKDVAVVNAALEAFVQFLESKEMYIADQGTVVNYTTLLIKEFIAEQVVKSIKS